MHHNPTFLDLYAQIDTRLRELLSTTELTFTTPRSRFLYLCEAHNILPAVKKLGAYIFNTHYKILHHNYQTTTSDVDLALYCLQELLNLFSEDTIQLTESVNISRFVADAQARVDRAYIDRLECYLKAFETNKTNKGYPLYKLTVADNELNEVVIYLWLEAEPNSTPFHRRWGLLIDNITCIKKIVFYNLTYSEKGYYFQNENTLIVIEPDFLVDITSIAECFVNKQIVPELFFLKFIKPAQTSIPMLKGNFVNYLLDAIFSGNSIDLERDFLQFTKRQIIKVLHLTEQNIQDILDDINNNHLGNLFEVANIFKSNTVTLEPSFISAEYGLQGRLDALIEYDDAPDRKTIFELKTSNPPNYDCWQNHHAQVMGYSLLLKSVFGEETSGYRMIFYSKATEAMLRNVTYSKQTISNILMCRNIIVSKLFKLINLEHDFIYDITTLHAMNLPNYLLEEVCGYLELYNTLRTYEKSYFKVMTAFIMKEMLAKKIGFLDSSGAVRHGFACLWNMSLAEKVANKIILQRLYYARVEKDLYYFDIKRENQYDDVVNTFRENDLILIYPALMHNGEYVSNPMKTPVLKAVLRKISTDTIAVQFRNEFICELFLQNYPFYFAEFDLSEVSIFDAPSHFIHFFKLDPIKRDILLGICPPRAETIQPATPETMFDHVLHKASIMHDYLLLQGPPGTGKTSKYLIGIVKQYLSTHTTPIVISAYTHKAIEEVCLNLQRNEIDFHLLGSRNHTNSQFSVNSEMEETDVYQLLQNMKSTLSSTRIFVSTVLNLLSEGPYLSKSLNLDLLIVDEASQILEYQLLCLVSLFKRFVLIGDHYQLPAIASQQITELPQEMSKDIGQQSLTGSLFERLYLKCEQSGWEHSYHLLSEHYRMHTQIANLINPFYQNRLLSTEKRQQTPLTLYGECSVPDEQIKCLTHSRTLFFSTKEHNHTRYSIEEANLVLLIADTVYKALGVGFTETTIGVICTWKLQVNKIRNILQTLPVHPLITVDTVERFQGSERDVIIYSTAVSKASDLNRMQSLTHDGLIDRKLNVAISRAKEQFILLGNADILNLSSHYKQVIETINNQQQ